MFGGVGVGHLSRYYYFIGHDAARPVQDIIPTDEKTKAISAHDKIDGRCRHTEVLVVLGGAGIGIGVDAPAVLCYY